MHDQAHHLRNLVRAAVQADATLAPGGPIVVLSGAQPRIGVTTAACGLAQELARLGKQTILIDANLHSPQVDDHFQRNSPTATRGSFGDILTGARRASELLIATADEGLRYIPGAPAARGSAPPLNLEAANRLAAELAALTRQVDVILIDAGAGMNAWVDRLWQLAVEVLIVSRPTGQGLVDAYTAAKVSQYQRHDNKLRLLLAGAANESQTTPLAARFAETCDQFLSIKTKPAATLPPPAQQPERPQRKQGSSHASAPPTEAHTRALRLLAADLTADFRATSLRHIRPPRASNRFSDAQSISLTQRRGDAEKTLRF
jgi:flagellar biosynthesis protein FlhG